MYDFVELTSVFGGFGIRLTYFWYIGLFYRRLSWDQSSCRNAPINTASHLPEYADQPSEDEAFLPLLHGELHL